MTASLANPCDLRGLAFIELAGPDPDALHRLLTGFGFSRTMRHERRAVDLYQQGDIALLLDRATDGFAARFTAAHGPCICAMGWKVGDAATAATTAVTRGARPADGDLRRADGPSVPAVFGIGDSLLYFVDATATWEALGFAPLAAPDRVPPKGFTTIDHLTNNVAKGELPRWAGFYKDVFGFTEVRYFDIRGVKTGLTSYALRSPDGSFCIPINEGTEAKSRRSTSTSRSTTARASSTWRSSPTICSARSPRSRARRSSSSTSTPTTTRRCSTACPASARTRPRSRAGRCWSTATPRATCCRSSPRTCSARSSSS
jgi:4-hydroxyphenylpyruvate dioxygenase-like putative hemolysin